MNANCQLAHHTSGRIRFQVVGIKARPEIGQLLIALILQLPGITAVRLNPASESLVITYDPAQWPEDSLLRVLHSNRIEAVASDSRPTATPSEPQFPAFPFSNCRLMHVIRGRVRLHLPVIKEQADLANALKDFLERQADIKQVRLSPRSESMIIQYNPAVWDSTALVTLIKAYDPDPTDLESSRQKLTAQPIDGAVLLKQSKLEIALAGSALAVSLLGGAAAAPLALGLLCFSTRSIFQRAKKSLVDEHQLTVESLDAAAVTVLALQGMLWQVAVLNLLLSSAELIRARTQEQARKELTDVLDCMTDSAWIKRNGQLISIPAEEVRSGEVVYVFPGERLPVDGIVLEGQALIDEHALTGESMPVAKAAQAEVYAATVVSQGELQVRATRTGDQTQVARIVQLIESAPIFDTRAQDYAHRWANRLVPYSFLGAGALALMGNFSQAAALLVIDYAAGFKVTAPTTVMSTMTRAARHGIFIRGGRYLEQLAEVKALVFDKTGTLTMGCPQVVELLPMGQRFDADELLTLTAAAEQCLTHPVAVAITNTAAAKGLTIPQRDAFEYQIGQGVQAEVNGMTVLVGSRRYLAGQGIDFDRAAEANLDRIEARAASPLCVAVDGTLVGLLGLADPIRPESAAVIQALRERDIEKIVMLTGDRAPVAEAVARSLDIEEYVAEVFPGDKLAAVKALQEQGYTVGVIGDGINDSPALAQANVGIAVNGGTALAQETADVVMLQGNLQKLIEAIDISRQGMALVRQNWEIVRIPNTIGLGLAFTGVIGPLGASIISDGAALVAGGNSLRPLLNGQTPPEQEAETREPVPDSGVQR
ncbi:MAG: heavy metal translocating P-type ATPase [Anaerolineae bacterium]|nr:heavy metal translocating P-type ATPase [Anaerolineae bacterium]